MTAQTMRRNYAAMRNTLGTRAPKTPKTGPILVRSTTKTEELSEVSAMTEGAANGVDWANPGPQYPG